MSSPFLIHELESLIVMARVRYGDDYQMNPEYIQSEERIWIMRLFDLINQELAVEIDPNLN